MGYDPNASVSARRGAFPTSTPSTLAAAAIRSATTSALNSIHCITFIISSLRLLACHEAYCEDYGSLAQKAGDYHLDPINCPAIVSKQRLRSSSISPTRKVLVLGPCAP